MDAIHEKEAKQNILWGTLREVVLAENIFSCLPKKTKKLIDMGCGDGYLLYYLNKHMKSDFWGFDISKTRIQRVQKNLPFVKTVKGDITKLKLKDNEFEAVVCSEVLEHIPDYKKALDELLRITQKTLIITVPNNQPLKKVICPKCGIGHYVDGHINKFNIKKFKVLLKKYKNIKVIKIRKFHTIYSYNKLTMKFPLFLRLGFDQFLGGLKEYISFLKPNYLLIKIVKNGQ